MLGLLKIVRYCLLLSVYVAVSNFSVCCFNLNIKSQDDILPSVFYPLLFQAVLWLWFLLLFFLTFVVICVFEVVLYDVIVFT